MAGKQHALKWYEEITSLSPYVCYILLRHMSSQSRESFTQNRLWR